MAVQSHPRNRSTAAAHNQSQPSAAQRPAVRRTSSDATQPSRPKTKVGVGHNGDDQFLRRAFDSVYQASDTVGSITLEDVKRAYRRVSPRTRWTVITIMATLALIWIALRLFIGGAALVKEMNQPTLEQRLQPPYPVVLHPAPITDGSTGVLRHMAGYEAAGVLPETAHPLLGCVVTGGALPPENCILGYSATFTEAVEYTGVETQARVGIVQFATPDEARTFTRAMHTFAQGNGGIGNYVLSAAQPVNYFFGATPEGWRMFVWSKDNWVYVVASPSQRTVDQVMNALPF